MRPPWSAAPGAHLHLADGRKVLDFSSLAECCNLGHQHPKLVAAIRAQAQQLCFVTSSWGAAPRAELAQRLLELSGFEGGRVFFTVGGADANEQAVKIARLAARKPRGLVITRDRSYHGATHLAMALSGDSRTQAQVDAHALGVRHVPPPYAYRCPFGSRNETECGVRAAAAVRDCIDADGRRGRGRGADGAQRRHQRHRGAAQLLAGAALACRGAGRLPHRRRGHERLRPLRRVVRLAAPRRGRASGPHDPGQGPDRRVACRWARSWSRPRSRRASSTRCSTPGSPTAATRWPARPASPRSRRIAART